ncbi:hypothetical protein H112_08073 [Trichophyton rubrum D6]|uniref:RNA polymerase II subunit B1 CTD phosphatase RPAP2 homolog n=4 Tax=Trichophyton TaxID=5550 RepID=A0A178EVI1_TRIRU|nr:uncharacterized protein TERG_00649 [Trichophyton rubrum CBS 118892]EZF10710.1 hypothetical protein H100_08101 [Trichophyton rubrum MR850]EZF37582.1 hypothetical protein H102_08057 [Trichophyton rubrum CBS 100081]EZF48150.1 hypothetical protein H103_08083 [Trichophyton rubrum CBS 288.86]EZF58872.1 hypothetical protein H104_08031 [Trichophyton rubrum CBS 289.86]EZF69405.1 hypothetical protein H105_08083 [Trichophyton soudanense CBS 452.61]EZF80152.1 hypothetical protein H110_08084 [Trichophy
MAARGSAHQDGTLKTSLQAVHASSAPASSQYRGKGSPDPRHMAIALHHARQIQSRKELELQILSHIETLMELPTTPGATVESPSAEDVSTFFSAIACFQPSDYDNLIQERNIDGSCGYTLCPKPRRKDNSKGGYRIVWGSKGSGPGGRGKDMKVVQKEKLEMWCSEECAERAMYIKVQLSEKPASERIGSAGRDFMLLEEARRGESLRLNIERVDRSAMRAVEENLQGLTLQSNDTNPTYGQDHLSRGLQDLSMQDTESLSVNPSSGAVARGLLAPTVIERDIDDSRYPKAPIFQPDSAKGGSVEGFHPRQDTQFRNWPSSNKDGDGDEDMDDFLPQI